MVIEFKATFERAQVLADPVSNMVLSFIGGVPNDISPMYDTFLKLCNGNVGYMLLVYFLEYFGSFFFFLVSCTRTPV